jgi:ribosomal protein S17
VTAIDAATRTVKLTLANGTHTTVKCGPGVANFKQIHINDLVKVTATEEIAVYLDKGKPPGTSGTTSVALSPIGAKPGGVMADTVQATVKITAIDTKTRKVTFVYKNGTSKTVKAGEHINLAKVKVGDSVTISQTQAVAISVEKP